MPSYQQKLEDWFRTEKLAGRLVDIKFFEVSDELKELYATDSEAAGERFAEAIYKIVTGQTPTTELPRETLDGR